MKLDLHVHTDLSPCSNMSIKDAVKTAFEKDIKAIAICNHNKPLFLEDVKEIASEIKNELGIVINPDKRTENEFYIIPGVEFSTEHGHIIGLFLEKADINNCSNIFEFIKDCNGISGIAHPFQKTNDFQERTQELSAIVNKLNFVETHSSRANYKNKRANHLAKIFAQNNNIIEMAGSDAHFTFEIGNSYVEIADEFKGIEGIKNAILNEENIFYSTNSKRTFIAKSQIVKNKKSGKKSFKTYLFYLYCFARDLGDKICQK